MIHPPIYENYNEIFKIPNPALNFLKPWKSPHPVGYFLEFLSADEIGLDKSEYVDEWVNGIWINEYDQIPDTTSDCLSTNSLDLKLSEYSKLLTSKPNGTVEIVGLSGWLINT